jgi:pimeloyl-ACP methyl ester carboxylesterase
MAVTREITLPDERTLVVHDSAIEGAQHVLLWHHGTPQTGALLEPLLREATGRGMRLISYGRPGYGGSTANPGREIASVGEEVEAILTTLDLDRIVTMGASSGGTYALATAALLPGRVSAVAALAAVAPHSEEYDWFSGMADPGALRAALHGRDARALFEETAEFDPASFVDADYAALEGEWSDLGADVGRSEQYGTGGAIDDDVALASPWGLALASITAPVLIVQGGRDRVVPLGHADWLVRHCEGAEFWLRPDEGHISILGSAASAMDWLIAHD